MSSILDAKGTLSKVGSQLLQWVTAMEEFASEVSDNAESRAIELLRGYHSLSNMFLKTATTGYQTSFDQYILRFRSIVDKIEVVLNTSKVLAEAPILFSLDLGIIPCLFYTAIKCRHPQIRRQAVALLRRAPLREGLWNAEEAAIVAEQAIKSEEQYVGSDDDGGSCWIPEEARIHDVDIREVTWDGEPSLPVVFKRRPYACGSLEESHVYIKTS